MIVQRGGLSARGQSRGEQRGVGLSGRGQSGRGQSGQGLWGGRALTSRTFAAAAMSCGRAASQSERPALQWYSVFSEYLRGPSLSSPPDYLLAIGNAS